MPARAHHPHADDVHENAGTKVLVPRAWRSQRLHSRPTAWHAALPSFAETPATAPATSPLRNRETRALPLHRCTACCGTADSTGCTGSHAAARAETSHAAD